MALIITPMSKHIKLIRMLSIIKGMLRAIIGLIKVLILVKISETLNTNIVAWKFVTNVRIDKIIS